MPYLIICSLCIAAMNILYVHAAEETTAARALVHESGIGSIRSETTYEYTVNRGDKLYKVARVITHDSANNISETFRARYVSKRVVRTKHLSEREYQRIVHSTPYARYCYKERYHVNLLHGGKLSVSKKSDGKTTTFNSHYKETDQAGRAANSFQVVDAVYSERLLQQVVQQARADDMQNNEEED